MIISGFRGGSHRTRRGENFHPKWSYKGFGEEVIGHAEKKTSVPNDHIRVSGRKSVRMLRRKLPPQMVKMDFRGGSRKGIAARLLYDVSEQSLKVVIVFVIITSILRRDRKIAERGSRKGASPVKG